MISKAISNAMVTNADNVRWRDVQHEFDLLPPLTMDLDLIFNTDKDDLLPYFEGWGRLQQWENTQMDVVRRQTAYRIEQATGEKVIGEDGNIIDLKHFMQLCMIPLKEAPSIEGSRLVYTPWPAHADPPDVFGLDLALLRDDEIEVGDFVMCEYGIAEVVSTNREHSIRVNCAVGTITLPRAAVAVPASKAGKDKLTKMSENRDRYSILPQDVSGSKSRKDPPKKKVADLISKVKDSPAEDQTNEVQDEQVEDDLNKEAKIEVSAINGMPAIVVYNDIPTLQGVQGWNWVDQYYALEFSTWKGIENFLEGMDQEFWCMQTVWDNLYAGMYDMKSGREVRATVRPNAGLIKNFFMENKRKLGKKDGYDIIKPYLTTQNEKVVMVFDENSHSPAIRKWLKTEARTIRGVRAVRRRPGMWVNFFKTTKEAATDLKDLVNNLKSNGWTVDVKKLNAELKEANTIIRGMIKEEKRQGK